MPIEVSCPACGVKLKAPESKAGKKAKCGKCGGRVRIPGSVGDSHGLIAAPLSTLPGDDDEPVPMASVVDELDPISVVSPSASSPPSLSNPGRPAFGSAASETNVQAQPKMPAVSPPPPPQEVLSIDDAPAFPPEPAASGDPFAFSAPHPPVPKGGSKSKQKPIAEVKPQPAPQEKTKEKPKPEPAAEERRGYVRPGERQSGNILLLAGVIGLLAIAAAITALVVYQNRNNTPDQTKPTEKKDESPTPPAETTKTDKGGKKDQKTDAPKKDANGTSKEDGKLTVAGSPLALPPNARIVQFRPLAAKPEFTQTTSNAPILIDAPFDKVKRFFPVENRIAQDVVVVWQSGTDAGGQGERFAVDLHSGTTGKRLDRFEFEGGASEPKCDVAIDGKLFAALTADGKVTVWNLPEKTKALEGFDPYADKPEHKKAGLAALFFARNSNNLVTVTTAGAVHLFEIATRKPIGEFVPPKGSAGGVVAGKNLAADNGRASVVLVVEGVVYQISTLAPLAVAWKLDLGGDLVRPLGIASVGVPGRVALAFETEAAKKKEQGLLFCLPNDKPLWFRLSESAAEPSAIHWAGTNMAVISTARGALWADAEGKMFAPIALAEVAGGKALHGTTESSHWYLIPNPGDATKSILLELSLPPSGLLDFRKAAEDKQPLLYTVRLDEKGLSK